VSKKSIFFGLIGLGATTVGFLGKVFYRNYINANRINDFGLAGFLPSYFYVIGFSLLLLIRPTRLPKVVIAVVTSASICYEFMQYISTGKFDYADILASIAGGLTALLIILKWEY
jgi:hypothetical protein